MMAVWTDYGRRRLEGAAVSVRYSSSVAGSRASLLLRASVLALAALCALGAMAGRARAVTLPDGRAYEQVTPVDKNGVDTSIGTPSTNGSAVNWEAIGGCCGASTASDELFQSSRGASGWSTTPETPTPLIRSRDCSRSRRLCGGAPISRTRSIRRPRRTTPTISEMQGRQLRRRRRTSTFTNRARRSAPCRGSPRGRAPPRPAHGGGHGDLCRPADERRQLCWLRYPGGADLRRHPLASLNTPPEYLYVRNVSAGSTTLVDVTTTTLSAAASVGDTTIAVNSSQAFAQGQPITIGSGA